MHWEAKSPGDRVFNHALLKALPYDLVKNLTMPKTLWEKRVIVEEKSVTG
jgi:hypothetical protein